jgi:hypothetical protein
VILLIWLAKVPSNAKMKKKVLNRKQKIPKSCLYLKSSDVRCTSPSTQRWFHAYENVIGGTSWFGVRKKNIAIILGERFHPTFEVPVLCSEVFGNTHGSWRIIALKRGKMQIRIGATDAATREGRSQTENETPPRAA